MGEEILYPHSIICRRLWEVLNQVEPRGRKAIDHTIEQVDVWKAFNALPAEYQQVLTVLLTESQGNSDWTTLEMRLQRDREWIKRTTFAAWSALSGLLNPTNEGS